MQKWKEITKLILNDYITTEIDDLWNYWPLDKQANNNKCINKGYNNLFKKLLHTSISILGANNVQKGKINADMQGLREGWAEGALAPPLFGAIKKNWWKSWKIH